MNSNLAEVGKPTRWPPGKSGNPAGKPPGTRTAFSQGFIRDFALVWAEEGLDAVRKVAKKSPEAFVAIAARICPNDVRLTLEQAIPGGMSLEDGGSWNCDRWNREAVSVSDQRNGSNALGVAATLLSHGERTNSVRVANAVRVVRI